MSGFAKNTTFLMFDGSIKKVQDIIIGDFVMGEDSKPRCVLAIDKGFGDMYDIIPIKGEKYTTTSDVTICLKQTNLGITFCKRYQTFIASFINPITIKKNGRSFKTKEEAEIYKDSIPESNKFINVKVINYLNIAKNTRDNLKLYRTGVEFPSQPVRWNSQIIGMWLGDGWKDKPFITTQDSIIYLYLAKECAKMNMYLDYRGNYGYKLSELTKNTPNRFRQILIDYNVFNNKHVPICYKVNDIDIRRKVLAGLIDTDGYYIHNCYEIIQKLKVISDDILFIARSLGFAAYQKPCNKSCVYKGVKFTGLYYRVFISGEGLEHLPVLLLRKQAHKRQQIKDALVTGLKILPAVQAIWYGFTLDGDKRCLLGDFYIFSYFLRVIYITRKKYEKI